MTFKLSAKGATVSATALAVAFFGAGIAFASPGPVNPDNPGDNSSQPQEASKSNESANTNPGDLGTANSKTVSKPSSGKTGKTARNNDNGLEWGDDWSLGGFPPINLSSLQPPEATVAIPLSLGLPGLGLPSLVIAPNLVPDLGGLIGGLGTLAAGAAIAPLAAMPAAALPSVGLPSIGLPPPPSIGLPHL